VTFTVTFALVLQQLIEKKHWNAGCDSIYDPDSFSSEAFLDGIRGTDIADCDRIPLRLKLDPRVGAPEDRPKTGLPRT
jgi:hypothetical protein